MPTTYRAAPPASPPRSEQPGAPRPRARPPLSARPRALVLAALLILALIAIGLATPALAQAGGASSAAPPAASAKGNAPARPEAAAPVLVLPVRGAIGPATASLIVRAITRARAENAQLLVLQLDTPGGLDLAMRDIIQAILASPVPVATHVYPGGARAASAGTYILYASHIAAMAPGTNLGAASPVRIGMDGQKGQKEQKERKGQGQGQEQAQAPATPPSASAPAGGADDIMERKQIHDAAAYIRGLAELRGRNADWAERAVRESVSLPASEAAAQRVVDIVAPDLPALLRALDGRTVEVAGGARTLRTAHAPILVLEPDWRSRLLAVITDPGIALILLTLGIYGLIYEFSAPGMVLPGVAGGICLLLGLFALQMLPVNYAGLALLVLGIGCMIAEAFLPSFGALGIGGALAFAFGAVMLIDTDAPGFGIPLTLVGALAASGLAASAAISAVALKARKQPVVSGDASLLGAAGVVVEALPGERHAAWADVRGERWRVRGARALTPGQHIRVTGRYGLVLDVEPEPAPAVPAQTVPGAAGPPGADDHLTNHGA